MNTFRLIALIGVLFCTNQAVSQTYKWEIGKETGLGMNTLRGNSVLDERSSYAFRFSEGVTFQSFLRDDLTIKTGISYENKGGKSSVDLVDYQGNVVDILEYDANFHYLTLPLLYRQMFGGEKAQFFINGGPYAGLLIIQTYTVDDYYDSYFEIGTQDYKRIDLGIAAGLGVRIQLIEQFYLSLEVRNSRGLANISAVPVVGEGTVKTNVLAGLFGLSVAF